MQFCSIWMDDMQELFSEFAREEFPELVSRLESFDEHILSISLSLSDASYLVQNG